MADGSDSSSGSPRPPPRVELLRERSLNSNLTFQEVLAHGPTSIPDSDDMNAALASILPENNRCRTASSPVPPAASSNGAAAVEAQKEKKEGGGGLLGWALQPVWMGLDALKWAGQTVNDKAVAPVVRYASPMGWASYLFDAVKNLTPQRARDLARIFGNATFNAVGLTQTPAGGKLRSAALRSVDTFASMISAPTGRQLVIDGAAGFVKLAAVVHEQHRSQYRHSRSSSGETETTGTGALPLVLFVHLSNACCKRKATLRCKGIAALRLNNLSK
eukprot:19559-Heterococcus_DN1.PRE.3